MSLDIADRLPTSVIYVAMRGCLLNLKPRFEFGHRYSQFHTGS